MVSETKQSDVVRIVTLRSVPGLRYDMVEIVRFRLAQPFPALLANVRTLVQYLLDEELGLRSVLRYAFLGAFTERDDFAFGFLR